MESSHKAPLLYVNIYELVFDYLKISLEDEECMEGVDFIINKEKLEALKYKCTSS